MTGRLLTEQEVAEVLGVTIKCLQDWRYHRRGPAFVKVGRLPRYRQSDLDSWIQSRTVPTSDSPASAVPKLRGVR